MTDSLGLQARDDEPIGCPSGVDQLLGGQTGPRTQVDEVSLHGSRLNAQEHGCIRDGTTGGDVGGDDVHLARRL